MTEAEENGNATHGTAAAILYLLLKRHVGDPTNADFSVSQQSCRSVSCGPARSGTIDPVGKCRA